MRALALLTVLLARQASVSANAAQPTQLEFSSRGQFKVIQFTDLHLGESRAADKATLNAVQAVLHAEQDAQLVVLSGDMVSGFKNTYSRVGWFSEQCVRFQK